MQEEDIILINIYAPNTGAPKYIKQILTDIKGETGNNTLIVGDFNASLTSMDEASIQKIKKETMVLNDALDQLILIDIYRTFHPKRSEYTFLSSTHGMFSRTDHMLDQK